MPLSLYICCYASPLGQIILTADAFALRSLRFESQTLHQKMSTSPILDDSNPILQQTCRWLDIYFSGNAPDFTPPLAPNETPFRNEVYRLLQNIPFGSTTTYGDIAQKLAPLSPTHAMSPQAVGNAAAHNPILLIIPCHRIIRSHGTLAGYAAGIDRQRALLNLEHALHF